MASKKAVLDVGFISPSVDFQIVAVAVAPEPPPPLSVMVGTVVYLPSLKKVIAAGSRSKVIAVTFPAVTVAVAVAPPVPLKVTVGAVVYPAPPLVMLMALIPVDHPLLFT